MKTYINLQLWILKNFICECLLKNVINFAKKTPEISEKDKAIKFHSRKSLLFDGQHVWIKKEGGLFDVGKFFLYQFSKKYNKNGIVLYRDNGLAVLTMLVAPKQNKLKKIPKSYLKITT